MKYDELAPVYNAYSAASPLSCTHGDELRRVRRYNGAGCVHYTVLRIIANSLCSEVVIHYMPREYRACSVSEHYARERQTFACGVIVGWV